MTDTESNTPKPALLEQINQLYKEGFLDDDKLEQILNGLRRKGERKAKKKNGKNGTEPVPDDQEAPLLNPVLISYAQSREVWGEGLAAKEAKLARLSRPKNNPVFGNSRFNFKQVVLQGLSTKEMAQRFPDHSWNSYRQNEDQGTPGYYLVSLENPLSNLAPAKEKELRPKDCYRLDFNLTVELLLTLNNLGCSVPELFYRTTLINGHGQEVCVGLQKGKIVFMEAKKASAEKKMGLCLVKEESWM